MNKLPKTDRKKTLSLQETINTYLKLIPKPHLSRPKLFEFDQDQRIDKESYLSFKPGHIKNRSILKRVDKIIQFSNQNLMKNSQMLKSSRNVLNPAILTVTSPPLIDSNTSPRLYQNTLPKYKKVPSLNQPQKCVKSNECVKKEIVSRRKIANSRQEYISPTYKLKGKELLSSKHRRQKSSIDFSGYSNTGWDAD